MKYKYKTQLEQILTKELQSQDPGPFAKVLISDKGEFAILDTGDKQTKRMLSRKAKDYLRTDGDVTFVGGESWYEPEKKEK